MGSFFTRSSIMAFFIAVLPIAISEAGDKQSATEKRLLKKVWESKDGYEIQSAIKELGELKKPTKKVVKALRRGLKSKNIKTQMLSAEALGNLGPISKSASLDLAKTMEEVIEEKGSDYRSDGLALACIKALGEIGYGAKSSISRLSKIYESKNPRVRMAVVSSLGSIGVGSKKVLGVLKNALSDESGGVRQSACWAFSSLGPDGSSAQKDLIAIAIDVDEDINVRSAATEAIGRVLDPKNPDGIDELNKLAVSKEKSLSFNAVIAIGRFGKLASRSTTTLKVLIDKKIYQVSDLAKASLMMVNPKEGLNWKSDIISIVSSKNVSRWDRDSVAWGILGLMSLGEKIIPDLKIIKKFLEKHKNDRLFVLNALFGIRDMGHVFEALLPDIERLKDSDDHRVRSQAKKTLEVVRKAVKDHKAKNGPP